MINNQLTVLIPTSPIPSHPDTAIIDETISNIRKYTDAEIVVMCDGLHYSLAHRRKQYTDYIAKLYEKNNNNEYGLCRLEIFAGHQHQTGMTKHVLETIDTPLIMFVEHDTSPIGDIPFKEICDLVEKSNLINYIRFNIFHKILDEHKHLMLGCSEFDNIKLTQTVQFSARPHIAKTEWYRNLLASYFSDSEHSMIEDKIHGVVQESYKYLDKDIFGLFIYTPDGNQLRSYHSDARGNDVKIIDA